MNNESTKGSAFELAASVWERRKWLGILVLAISFSFVSGVVMFLPNIYKSTATVLVEQEQIAQGSGAGEVETRLRTINEEILSRARLEQLIKLFGLYPDLRKQARMEEVVDHMRQDIRMEAKNLEQNSGRRSTIAFALSYRGEDPQTVARVANTLASFYVEENSKARGRQATETAEFFRAQLDEMKKRIDTQEQALETRARSGAGPGQAQANLFALDRLSAERRMSMERRDRARERREVLAKQLADALSSGSAEAPSLKADRLTKLRQELAELRMRFTDEYPDVIRTREQIAALERGSGEIKPDKAQKADREADPSVQRLRQEIARVDAEINGQKNEEERLQRAIDMYQRRIETAPPAGESSSLEVVRDYQAMKELYNSLLKRYTDAQQTEQLDWRQFRILDSAIPPNHPEAPNRPLLIFAGLALSLGLAAAAVVIAEQIATSFHTADDLRAFTKVPVLARIPRIITQTDINRRGQRFRVGLAAAIAGWALIVGVSYYVAHDNKEMVRLLMRADRVLGERS